MSTSLNTLRNIDIGSGSLGGHVHAGLVAQVVDRDLATDQSITNPDGEVVLVSTTINKIDDNSKLKMLFTASASNDTNATQMRFRMRIDGRVVRACGCRGQNNFAQAAALQHIERSLPRGTYVVDVQWSTTGGTASIRPVTHSDDESAMLVVEEILRV